MNGQGRLFGGPSGPTPALGGASSPGMPAGGPSNSVFSPFGGGPSADDDGPFARTVPEAPPASLLDQNRAAPGPASEGFSPFASGPAQPSPFGGSASPFGNGPATPSPFASSPGGPSPFAQGGAPSPFAPSQASSPFDTGPGPGGPSPFASAPGGPSPFSTPGPSPFGAASGAGAPDSSPFGGGRSPFDNGPAKEAPKPTRRDSGPQARPKEPSRPKKDKREPKKDKRDAKNDKNARSRKRGRGRSGLPLLPIAVATIGVLLSLGILLVFYILPRRAAQDQYIAAEKLVEQNKLQEALAALEEIDPDFAPAPTATLHKDILDRIHVRTLDDINEIRRLIDTDELGMGKLDEAEASLDTTLGEALPDDKPEVEKLRPLIAAARQCREVRKLLADKEFRQAYEIVEGLKVEDLTESNKGIRNEVVYANNTVISENRSKIIAAARRGDKDDAYRLLSALEKDCIPAVASELDNLRKEIGSELKHWEDNNETLQVVEALRRLQAQGKHFQLFQELTRLQQTKPRLAGRSEIQSLASASQRYFQTVWNGAVQQLVAKLRAGESDGLEAIYKRLKVSEEPQVYVFMSANQQGQPGLGFVNDEAQIQQIWGQVVEQAKTQVKPGG